MKIAYRIFFTFLSFAAPYMLLGMVTFGGFFMYGSGFGSGDRFEADKHWWITAYIVIGIIHLGLLYRIVRPWHMALKLVIALLLVSIYIYYGLEFRG